MKNKIFLVVSYFGLLMLYASIVGCGDDCSGCPEDVEFPAAMELRVPYQVDQVIRFSNATGDTIILNCTEKEYYQDELRPTERPYSECCPSYFVENVACKLSGDDGNLVGIRTDYSGSYSIAVAGNLKGVDFHIRDPWRKIDTLLINGQIFLNVSISDENNPAEVSVFLGNDGQGIVGFINNGEEWALVE